jgi:dipeptidyl-peptidase III
LDRQYLLEQIDDAAVVQLYADGFQILPQEQKVLVWHLTQAALAGRDIYYDQRYRHNLEMRGYLEAILRAANTDASAFDAETLAEIRRYTKLFWINTGPYNSLTARKFVLKCSLEALVAAAEQAQALGVIADEPGFIRLRIERLASAFFDASSEPMVTNKSPEPGGDILRDSA